MQATNALNISVAVGDRVIIRARTALGVSHYHLYGMVNSVMAVRSGKDQPQLNPGDGRWLIVQLPHGQALDPNSHQAVTAADYQIDVRKQGYQCYARAEVQQLNWDRVGATNRGGKFADTINGAYTKCVLSGRVRGVGVEAAHVCPASANFQLWDWMAQSVFHEDVQMTNQFLTSASNGVLLRADLHTAFDAYSITVYQDFREEWCWRVLAMDPVFATLTGDKFDIKRPKDDADRKRVVCTLNLHFMYATYKFASTGSPV